MLLILTQLVGIPFCSSEAISSCPIDTVRTLWGPWFRALPRPPRAPQGISATFFGHATAEPQAQYLCAFLACPAASGRRPLPVFVDGCPSKSVATIITTPSGGVRPLST